MKKRMAVLCAACILLSSGTAKAATPEISAECAAVYDTLTGRFLYEKNADCFHGIASTTKIMTALLVLESAAPEENVTVSAEAAAVEGSRMSLCEGQRVTVRTLLYGLLLSSGNDAALALAEHCGGEAAFVERMNRKAAELGLTAAHFENPHGLDGECNGATARELCLLMAAAMENPDFREITAAREYDAEGFHLCNHNRLLGMLEGACGGKTGYTRACGRCLVSCVSRHGRMLILVTLNDPDDWADHTTLAEACFAPMREMTFCEGGKVCCAISVTGGDETSVPVQPESTLQWYLTPEETLHLRTKCCLPHFIYAPVQSGETVGWMEIYWDGRCLGGTRLVCANAVRKKLPS